MDVDALLADLDPEQRAAVVAPAGPVCILAGAGTGKTRTITRRIAYGAATATMPAEQVLAVTFTARAAGELRDRLRALGCPGVQARTFHAAALRQLSYFGPRVLGGPLPRLLDTKARLVAEAAARRQLTPSRTELRDLIAELEWATSRLIPPERYPQEASRAGRSAPWAPDVVARLARDYTQAKERVGVMDFEDILLLTTAALEEHPDVAAEMRARYRHFVVDEYQDVTPLQQRLLTTWLGDRDSLTVVGDTAQTIYSFAGADASLLTGFAGRHPGTTVVHLVRDYRSTPQVVEVANRLLSRDPSGHPPLRAVPGPGPAVVATEAPSEPQEARLVAERITALLGQGVRASEVAVLFRINAVSEAYEKALADAGVSYLLRGGERFFNRPEVRDAVRLLRGAARSGDTGDELVTVVAETLRATGHDPARPPAGGQARERWENLAALARLAEGPDAPATLEDFVAMLADRADAAHAPAVEGVTLASLHAAKGLEWEAVFLVGLVEGTVPIVHATTPEQVAEERRLLYVGVTRARRHLSLSWSRARTEGGRPGRGRSRFLDGLLPELVATPTPPGRPTGAGGRSRRTQPRCRVCGRALDSGTERMLGRCPTCPGQLDDALFDRLRSWRSDVARELRQPAFCVFTDAQLIAIAERRPGTRAELSALPGVGATKLERWGEVLLGLCAESARPPAPAH